MIKFTYSYLLNFILLSLCISQNSITIKIGERYLDTDGLENIEQVIQRYEQKHQVFPQDYQISDDLGYLYFSAKQYDKALDFYLSLLPKFESHRTGIVLNISRTYEEMEELEKAVNIIALELEKCNKCSVFYYRLGIICQRQQLHKEAYQYYSMIDTAEIVPNYRFYYNFADVCFEADTTLEMGIRFAKKAIKLKPEWYIYKTLGDLLFKTEKFEEALDAYLVFIEEYPIEAVLEKVKIINKKMSK